MYADTRINCSSDTFILRVSIPHPYSCFAEIPQIIEVASKFGLQCISGERSCCQEKKYFADDVHPNSKGAALLANLFEALKQQLKIAFLDTRLS